MEGERFADAQSSTASAALLRGERLGKWALAVSAVVIQVALADDDVVELTMLGAHAVNNRHVLVPTESESVLRVRAWLAVLCAPTRSSPQRPTLLEWWRGASTRLKVKSGGRQRCAPLTRPAPTDGTVKLWQ